MQIAVLGPLSVARDGINSSPSAPKLRTVLAMLALNADRVVQFDQFVDELWEQSPPASASTTLQTYVYQLRKSLRLAGDGADPAQPVLLTRPHGYELRLGTTDTVDARRFAVLLDSARDLLDGGSIADAASRVRESLALWHGAALSDIPVGPSLAAMATQLDESRKAALDLRFDLELRLGRHGRLVDELAGVVKVNPTHEGYSAKLMLALYRCGRRVEALEVYHRVRGEFVAELGIEPSAALRTLHQQILADAPELAEPGRDAAPAAGPAAVSAGDVRRDDGPATAQPRAAQPPVAAQSPAERPAPEQTGHEQNSREQDSPGQSDAERADAGPRWVTAVDAVPSRTRRTAPDPAREHPTGQAQDGQAPQAGPGAVPAQLPADVGVFVGRDRELIALLEHVESASTRLEGGGHVVEISGAPGTGKSAILVHVAHRVRRFFPDGQLHLDLSTGGLDEVLADALRACGVPLRAEPTRHELACAYRAFTAGRRVLVVLDDATDSAEVELLRPNGTGSVLLVASRRWIRPRGSVRVVTLAPLTVNQSLELLSHLIGRQRVLGELDCAGELMRLCGGLPLAVSALATFLVYRPERTLRQMYQRLDRDPVAVLRMRCGNTDLMRSVLASCDVFGDAGQLAMRALARGGDLVVSEAGPVLGLDADVARTVLEDLESAHLIEEIATRQLERTANGPRGEVPRLHAGAFEPVYRVPTLIGEVCRYVVAHADALPGGERLTPAPSDTPQTTSYSASRSASYSA